VDTERALDTEAAGERARATSWRQQPQQPPRLPGALPALMPARQAAAWSTRTVRLLCCTLPAPCLAQAADCALWRMLPSPAPARAGRACWQHPAQHWARIRQAAHRFAQGVLRFKGDEAIVLPRAVAAHARRYGGQVVAGNAAAGAGAMYTPTTPSLEGLVCPQRQCISVLPGRRRRACPGAWAGWAGPAGARAVLSQTWAGMLPLGAYCLSRGI